MASQRPPPQRHKAAVAVVRVALALLCFHSTGASGAEADAAESAEGTCTNPAGPGCSASAALERPNASLLPAPYWPYKGRDLNRTGFSPHAGPFDLSQPVWEFQEPMGIWDKFGLGVFHSSPILDGDLNTYIASTNGVMYSVNKKGDIRWSFKCSGKNPGNPALLDGVLYTASDDGMAVAINASNGKSLWTSQIGGACPDDTWSAVAINGTVIIPATPMPWMPDVHTAEKNINSGGEMIVALDIADGSERWKYNHAKRAGTITFNVQPIVVDGSVIFDDMSGGVFRLSFETGTEQWYVPGPNPGTWSTGSMLLGPEDMLYVARNRKAVGCNGNDGMVRAHDLKTGAVIWDHSFKLAMNVGLAIGKLAPSGHLAVIAVPGNNTQVFPNPPPIIPAWSREYWWRFFGMFHSFWYRIERQWVTGEKEGASQVVALDAKTGKTLWVLDMNRRGFFADPPVTPFLRLTSFGCAPDIAGNPSIGADGTVYVSWSGGKLLAIRDANNDGRIDPKDAKELSAYPHRYGANGNPAIAPGLVIAPCCNGLAAFASSQQR